MQFQGQYQQEDALYSEHSSSKDHDCSSDENGSLTKPLLDFNRLNLPTRLDDWEGPTLFYCEICQSESVSVCEYKSSCQTYGCAILLFFLFTIAGLLIPFIVNTCKDRRQVCPSCKTVVGIQRYEVCVC